jgi:Xaa-Pro aminopeptidase
MQQPKTIEQPSSVMGFAPEEYASRVERLRSEMKERQVDAVLLDDCESLAYFTGYEVSVSFYRAAIIPQRGAAFFVLRAIDVTPCKESTWIEDVIGYPDWESPAAAVARQVQQRGAGLRRIGLDLGSHALTVDMYHQLQRALPGVELVDVTALPWLLRKRKSAAEIAKLRTACAIADKAVQTVITAAKPGFTERQAAAMAAETFVRLGGDPGLLGIVTAGRDWDFLHGHLHNTPLTEGDILHLELCPRVDGYSARMMRDVMIGPVPEATRKAAETLCSLQEKQIAALKPGARAADIDRILRQGVLDAGLRKTYDNITGYTIGYYSSYMIRGNDFTWVFHPKADWQVEQDMVFHMYASAAGFSLSDTVLVTASEPEYLTKTPRRLFSTAR